MTPSPSLTKELPLAPEFGSPGATDDIMLILKRADVWGGGIIIVH